MEQFWLWLWYVVRDLFAFIAWFCWAALIVGLLLVERRRRRRRAARPPETVEPECANCGYLVVGITSTRCPECGSDLRGRGTILDRYLYTSLTAKAVLCLLLLSVPAFFGWRSLERRLPRWRQSSMTYVLNGPASGAYRLIEAKVSMQRWEWPWRRYDGLPYDSAELRLTHLTGAERGLRMPLYGEPAWKPGQLLPGTSPTTRLTTRPAGHVSTDDMLQWMQSQGIDTSNLLVRDEAREVSDIIEANAFHVPYTPGNPFSTRTPVGAYYFDRPWWMLGGWIGLCIVVWLLIIRRVARGAGRIHATSEPAPPDARPASPDTVIGR
jgi:hypothetical protein